MTIKKVTAILGAVVITLWGSNALAMRPGKVKYDAVLMCAITDRLTMEEGLNANETIVALYEQDFAYLRSEELAVVQEWKKRLHQHEVEERKHFDGDEEVLLTGAVFSKKRSTSAKIGLGDIISIIADGELFGWSRNGGAIVADSDDPVVGADGIVISVRKLFRREGVCGKERPNRGVHAVFKFTTAGGGFTSDIGKIYLK
jgi:hypothetical protein